MRNQGAYYACGSEVIPTDVGIQLLQASAWEEDEVKSGFPDTITSFIWQLLVAHKDSFLALCP